MTFEPFLTSTQIAELQRQEEQADKAQKRTPEQIEAIYTNGNNVLVSASAGSGKTFVMVERIIDKIKRGIAINQLFISTFTVKAAGELKERLEKRLTLAIAEANDPSLRQHLTSQLADVQHADIGTMDAFTQKLVQQYGYLLGIAPTFRILTDKSEQDILKNQVFQELFDHYYHGEQAQTFLTLVKNFTGQAKSSKAFQQVVDKIYTFIQSTSQPDQWLQEVFLKGYEDLQSEDDLPVTFRQSLLTQMQQVAQHLEEITHLDDYKQVTAKGEPTATYKKHLAIINQLYEWSAGPDLFPSLSDLAQAVTSLIPAGNDVTVAGTKYPIFKQLHEDITRVRHTSTILTYQAQSLPLLTCLQAFVRDFANAYLKRKIEEASFEFADISHFAIRILSQHPDICQLYRDHYHEVMVDEYQDNNHTQEAMLDLLSNGHNRFMVGDIKQSIYRFRQADPQIFNQKFKTYQADPTAGKLILLKENFRSQTEVLDSTNSLFSRLMDEDLGDITYDETHTLVPGSDRQKIAQPAHTTQCLIYDTDEEEGEQLEETEDQQDPSLSQGEITLVIKEIIRLHNEEGVAFDDITLLVPSRTRNDSIMAAFHQHGIPLVTDGGQQNYLKSLEVQVMLDTLRCIDNPLNDYALVALLRSPMFNYDEDELARLSLQIGAEPQRANLYEKLTVALAGSGDHPELVTDKLRSKLKAFEAIFQNWRSKSKRYSLHDLIWTIYNDKFYYDYVGALPNGEQRQANLYALALRADGFEKTGFKGLSRFITMIDQVLASDNDLADVPVSLPKKAVQLMTVHKSKGLEFKYVFLLNLDKSFFSNRREVSPSLIINRHRGIGIKYIADLKERFADQTSLPHLKVSMETIPYQINQRQERLDTLAEQMRLLYVAMTRAETKLYLVGKGSRQKLEQTYNSQPQNGKLTLELRQKLDSFQAWFLAVHAAFGQRAQLHYQVTYVTDSDLTADKVGRLTQAQLIQPDNLSHNRQSEDLADALKQLEEVDHLNQSYRAAIELPTVRTPSQIKTFYQPLLDQEGLDIMEKVRPQATFELPDFGKTETADPTQIGSAMHELMQRIDLSQAITLDSLEETLSQVNTSPAVKDKIDLKKVLDFFGTDFGQRVQANRQNLQREAPFAMLVKDQLSQENFVVRGIVDGFIKEPDRITLFDYKTDRYSNSQTIVDRYRSQMSLYAEALSRAYHIEQVDKYLVLLGGSQIEVVKLD